MVQAAVLSSGFFYLSSPFGLGGLASDADIVKRGMDDAVL